MCGFIWTLIVNFSPIALHPFLPLPLGPKLFITQGNLVKSFRRRSSKVTHIHGQEVAKIFPYKTTTLYKELNNFKVTLVNISRIRALKPCFFRHPYKKSQNSSTKLEKANHVHNVHNSMIITRG